MPSFDNARALVHSLTARQREVLELIAREMNTKQMAAHLHLSVKTIETHRAGIMTRTNIRSIARLTLLAVRAGLVEL